MVLLCPFVQEHSTGFGTACGVQFRLVYQLSTPIPASTPRCTANTPASTGVCNHSGNWNLGYHGVFSVHMPASRNRAIGHLLDLSSPELVAPSGVRAGIRVPSTGSVTTASGICTGSAPATGRAGSACASGCTAVCAPRIAPMLSTARLAGWQKLDLHSDKRSTV